MTDVKFLIENGKLYGFHLSGHSTVGCDDIEGRLVCSAVSSAAYMAANTVIEIIGDKYTADITDGKMVFMTHNPSEKTIAVLEGFKLHITELSSQYKNRIRIFTEV